MYIIYIIILAYINMAHALYTLLYLHIHIQVFVILLYSRSKNPMGKNIDFFQDHSAINKIVIPNFSVVPKPNTVKYLV